MSKDNKNYEHTSDQLDGITTTVISTILTAFIVSQNFLNDSTSEVLKAASIFALTTMFLHFLSFVFAHYVQIYKIKEKNETAKLFSGWTLKINSIVYIMVSIMFAFVAWIILAK